jgi:NADH:ubiquinone oxidoreductase subunit 5 (subunit L)/multisubunit Na+/H+ antiporter MnhA subunit
VNNFNDLLSQSISLFIFIPLLAFFASLFWQNKQEKPIAQIVLFTKAFYIGATVICAVLWLANGSLPINQKLVTLYQTDHFVFAIQFYYDLLTVVYSIVGAVLFFLVSTFSRYYMHRDEGYKRFFSTILFFALGYNLIIFSGNFETLFIGWEIIGLSSFLLIAFYRNRYLPVKNAFKVISNYRLSDLALILAMWMMHHLTHQNISFSQLAEAKAMAIQNDHSGMAIFIVLMIVLAAMIKSAQVPFTSWLPRAMEGPTTSSAIFYGSLSVHIGVFILLRTWPFWQDMLWAKITIIIIGALTGIMATLIARVQPTVKTQIAYSSAAQIGIIFIEVALGWHVLALIHFAGNAFLRTYQLLVSPSVVNYLVHHQYFHYHPPQEKSISKWQAGLYVLGVKEWNLDGVMHKYLWSPFKWLGTQLQFLGSQVATIIFALIAMTALLMLIAKPGVTGTNQTTIAALLLACALAVVLFAFSHRSSAVKAWLYLLLAHLFIMTGIGYNVAGINTTEIVFYATGIVAAFALGFYCLKRVESIDKDITLNSYHGYVYEEKYTALLFLLAAIGMLGFPITAAFIGIDVLFTYVGDSQVVAITLLTLCLVFIELAAIRIFLRIFLGQHKKLNHPIAFRSS